MLILDVEARTTIIVKRSLAGYAGVDNDLFYRSSTMMLGDGKKKLTELLAALKGWTLLGASDAPRVPLRRGGREREALGEAGGRVDDDPGPGAPWRGSRGRR